jgi:trehalose 6-phosphate phosphatase
LRPWLEAPGRSGVIVDFDGTLAPIVTDFLRAEPLPGAADVLARLAERYARVAVVSGRPLAYLAHHLSGAGRTELVGLYGLERARGATSGREDLPGAAPWREAVADAADAAETSAPPGVVVERKGLSVTLHYRTAPQNAGWAEQFAAGQAAQCGLVALPGKMCVELRPPLETDKGTVVRELSAGLDAVCFIGDDQGDLAAFDELSRLREAGVATLSVAVKSPEAPPALLSRADLIVDGPPGAMALLRQLASTVGAPAPAEDARTPGQDAGTAARDS